MPPEHPDRPLVSFFVTAYRQEHLVRAAIEGAFAQTWQPLEILLSDDCSPDGTWRVMQEMAAANGASLLRCLCPVVRSFDPRDVEVEVAVATRIAIVGEVQVRAVSRAEYVP